MRHLFDEIRRIKGKPLTQLDVDAINTALGQQLGATLKPGLLTSTAGISLIHSFEALKLIAYKDPGSKNGLPITNGWGTTVGEDGKAIPLGQVWTKDKADRLFARDIAKVEVGVNLLLNGKPTTQNQFDAMVSFAYNVGLDLNNNGKAEGLGESTLLRKHLAGDYAGAKGQFALWVYNDGVKMNGLMRRRAAEAVLYGGAA
ncbi:MAG TPA: lysozyme [Sphingobium sp.]|uniref:lysozyme n=1 Tax=Sphingobium sp. TaxID=1912891 RepID=UPI002ED48598